MTDRTHLTFAGAVTALTVAMIAAGLAAAGAQAQTPSQSGKLIERGEGAARIGERFETADCRTALGEEVAPVSFDGPAQPEAWVIVDREGGAPVSATRIDPENTVLIRSIRCGGNDWVKPVEGSAGS